ncbi:thioredoxin-like protein [Suillus variegatus]|nr:thioredoxin-like protein [Suillus variegatus]
MATKQILRAQLRSYPANGHSAYLPQVRKIVLEYCQNLPSSTNARTFISNDLQRVAWQNPHVEFVVKQRNGHEPIARGFYVNGRDKVIPLQEFEVNGVEKKIKQLKRGRIVESTTEAARGIWSGLHVDTPFKI